MNPARQFDQHPDAEILNGFVENALPTAERAEVLAHLGGCGRCRQVVYLAQDAMPAAEAPARAPIVERRDVDGERAWILRWRSAWAAAVAFAAIAAIAVFVTIRHGAPTQEVAKLATSAAPTAAAAPPPPAAPTKPAENAKGTAEPQRIAPGVAAPNARPQPHGEAGAAAASEKFAAPAPPAEGGPVPHTSVEAKSFAPPAPLGINGPVSTAMRAPPTAMRATRFQSAPEAFHGDQLSAKTELSKASGASSRQGSPQIELNSAPAELHAQPVTPAQDEMVSPMAVADVASAGKPGLILLPSGLPLVSTAEAGHLQLAIDAMGSLFLSRDQGKSWQPVKRQWTGQLVKVRMAPLPGGFAAPPFVETEQAKPPAAAATIPAPLFEIVNGNNAVWTSADGKTWTAK